MQAHTLSFSPQPHPPAPWALFQFVCKLFLAFGIFHCCCQCCRDIYCHLVIQESLHGSQRLQTAPGLTVDKQIICQLGLVEEYLDRNSKNPNQTGSLRAECVVYCSGLWVWKCQAQTDFFRLLGFTMWSRKLLWPTERAWNLLSLAVSAVLGHHKPLVFLILEHCPGVIEG